MILRCEEKDGDDGPLGVSLKRSGVSHGGGCLVGHKKGSSAQPGLLASEHHHGRRIDRIAGGIPQRRDPPAPFVQD
jgi:hypothetical protein